MKVYLTGLINVMGSERQSLWARLHPVLNEFFDAVIYQSATPLSSRALRARRDDNSLPGAAWNRTPAATGHERRDALEGASAVIAVFVEPDADSQTASDLGYAFARGLPIFAYRTAMLRGGSGQGITNEQLPYLIEASGGRLCRSLVELREAILGLIEHQPTIHGSRLADDLALK